MREVLNTIKEMSKRLAKGDFIFLIIAVALIIFGAIMVFGASYYYSISMWGDPYYYLKREIIFLIIGFFFMIFFATVDYNKWAKFDKFLFILALGLLLAVLSPIGTNVTGAQRWIYLGPVSIMPGEVAKLCAIMIVASFYTKRKNSVTSIKGIAAMLAMSVLFALLIMRQPNMSTAVTLVGIVFIMMIIAGMPKMVSIGLITVGIGGILYLILSSDYRRERLMSFLHPFEDAAGDGYQVVQSLLAMGSGGLTGVGLGKSVQKTLYLPEPQNDFILAIIGEELGFIGVMVLMLAYLLLIWRCIKIAIEAPNRYGRLVAGGIATMIGLQVLLNVAVVTSSMPPTGVILPFISYGGNALWIFMISSGLMVNISAQTRKKQMQQGGERLR